MPQKLAGLRNEPPKSEPCAAHACRERDSRSARRAGGGERRVPRIQCRAKHVVEGVGAGTEFRCIRLGVANPSFRFEPVDQHIGFVRDVVGIDRRAVGAAYALHFRQVLDGHRQAGQQAALRHGARKQRVRMSACTVKAQGWQGVDLWIDTLDARFQCIEQVVRLDIAAFEQRDDIDGAALDQRHIRHD
jgi:hypothetical protein